MQTASRIEEDISRLESGIRQLKIQYDMFFAGALPREPLELRCQLERLMKRWATASIRKYHHRFHFNSLVARYNCLSELWGKTIRNREEGDRAPAAASADRKEKLVASCRLRDAVADQKSLRRLHAKFVAARERAGVEGKNPSFDKFASKIGAQAAQIKTKAGCEQVELRVVASEGKILLTARPGR